MQKHIHTYDIHGNMTCCTHQQPKSAEHHAHSAADTGQAEADSCGGGGCSSSVDRCAATAPPDDSDDEDGSCCQHENTLFSGIPAYVPPLISFALLLIGLACSYVFQFSFFDGAVKLLWYVAAYIPVGLPVLQSAWAGFQRREFFTEFTLMSAATLGAFAIGEYPEGVAVMLFYAVGEWFQERAVKTAKSNIKALLDVRPNTANVVRNEQILTVHPETVAIGETIQVKVGEKIPLDGVLLSPRAVLNTAALTGESKPQGTHTGERVMAGAINLENVIDIEVDKAFHDSSIARILQLVQDASARKSKTELLIRRLAKIYTPIVAGLALLICLLPALVVTDYVFSDWLYRALIFLVISCPCALVISIPLGYFGGLGAASQQGLLLKGAMFLDRLTQVNIVAMDKTGTLTEGVFAIKNIVIADDAELTEAEFMASLIALESQSTHPIAKAICAYHQAGITLPSVSDIHEIAGKGLVGQVNDQQLLAGNAKLLAQFDIEVPNTDDIVESIVLVARGGRFIGYVTIADQLKADAHEAVSALRAQGIKQLVMLSGDKDSITRNVAETLKLDSAAGGLLPEDKLAHVERLKQQPDAVVAFVGDGINDAPVLAASDVSIAMGGLGSDVAIETADVVIQSDAPAKIATAISIGQATRRIIWQNIALAFIVKAIVLLLGALGMATMWAAVFADVGVALLAIMNAVRLQKMRW